MAVFLIVAGLTGTVLVFYEECEHWLNPHLYTVAIGMPTPSVSSR